MNRQTMKKTIIFTLMLGLNWIPVFFCATFYYKGGPFVYSILIIQLLALIIGNFFASSSLMGHVALSFNLIAATVIATITDTDYYTAYISNDGLSYGIGFFATIVATLLVLCGSFIALFLKNKLLERARMSTEYNSRIPEATNWR